MRIPLLIRGPGFLPGEIRADLTANVDVPATIMDAANVKPARPLDGYSLLGKHRRRFLLLERLNGSSGSSADAALATDQDGERLDLLARADQRPPPPLRPERGPAPAPRTASAGGPKLARRLEEKV